MDSNQTFGKNSKIKIKWNVLPMDYSKDGEKTIISLASKKYNVSKDNISVEPVLCNRGSDGMLEAITNDITQNIQDKNFQIKLFKEYLKERGIEKYDFDKILSIDDEINNEIDYEVYDSNKRYSIKWIKWSNFMSYGEDNYFDFRKLSGLCLLTSEPANQGGKSTFCIDLLRFLLFGKVTREDDWTLDKGFNRFLDNATEYSVEGCICIDNVDYIIRRVVKRPKLENRGATYKASQKIEFYKLINDEYIELEDEENINESSTTETSKVIKEAIGNEKDFDLMIYINSDNLKDLIGLKSTDRGRLITRWIGLLPLEDKDIVARNKFNKIVSPKLLLNRYNKEECLTYIEELKEENKGYCESIKVYEDKKKECETKLAENNKLKENLLESKSNIDESLTKIDVNTVNTKINSIAEEGKKKRNELNAVFYRIKELSEITFDEEEYKKVNASVLQYNSKLSILRNDVKRTKDEIERFEKSEYCPTCGAKLANVDNSEIIKKKKEEYNKIVEDGKKAKAEFDELCDKQKKLEEAHKLFDEKNRLELKKEALQIQIDNLTLQYKENIRVIKDINDNIALIEKNNKINASLNVVNANINNETNLFNSYSNQIISTNSIIKQKEKEILQYEEIVKKLTEEEDLVYHWKLYLDMIGKNGISKLVLRNTLPLINGKLKHLLNDVCDFDIEVAINSKNEVTFNIVHDGKKGSMSSGSGFEQTVAGLALRSVLSSISTFSKPSFVVIDEILGGAADENYENIKRLYDKIVKDYDYIFEITHNKAIFDWHEKTIVVKKNNNISTIVES